MKRDFWLSIQYNLERRIDAGETDLRVYHKGRLFTQAQVDHAIGRYDGRSWKGGNHFLQQYQSRGRKRESFENDVLTLYRPLCGTTGGCHDIMCLDQDID